MISRPSLLLACLASISTCTFAAESPSDPAEKLVPIPFSAGVSVGMSRTDLVARLGQPSERISASVWVYAEFHPLHRPAHERHDALLVVVSGDRVIRLRLVHYDDVAPALAKFRAAIAKTAGIAAR